VSSRVALTFDAEHPDRPGCRPGNTDRILDALRDESVRVTFFVQGRWASAYPDQARRIADDEHLIGHHSHYHARTTLLTADGIARDAAQGREAIERATGVDPSPWYRLPFGDGHDDPRVIEVLEGLGYRNVHWNVEVEDWEPWRTADALVSDVLDAVSTLAEEPGTADAVVLLHTWPDGTAEAIGPLVHELRGRGARFATVDRLEALP
jgi:peptidoglycan/xylan/chitin deacetylase (PgdA/CDA1 family)